MPTDIILVFSTSLGTRQSKCGLQVVTDGQVVTQTPLDEKSYRDLLGRSAMNGNEAPREGPVQNPLPTRKVTLVPASGVAGPTRIGDILGKGARPDPGDPEEPHGLS